MKGYLIKVTYTEGIHEGYSYLLGKGTWVMDNQTSWADMCYKTLGAAKRICKKWYEENEVNRRFERMDYAAWVAKGGEERDWFIYESQTFEPYEVEMVE